MEGHLFRASIMKTVSAPFLLFLHHRAVCPWKSLSLSGKRQKNVRDDNILQQPCQDNQITTLTWFLVDTLWQLNFTFSSSVQTTLILVRSDKCLHYSVGHYTIPQHSKMQKIVIIKEMRMTWRAVTKQHKYHICLQSESKICI